MRCAILAVGDFPEGSATSQRLYLLAKILNEGLGDTSLWIMHATNKVPVEENCLIAGEWNGVKFVHLSGKIVRPSSLGGALVDTIRGIYKSARLMARRGDGRPDVMVLYTPTFLKFIIPMFVAKALRIPLIVELCEIYSKTTDKTEVGLFRRLANSGESFMEKLTAIFSSGLLVISRGIRTYYEKLGIKENQSYLLPVLIDLDRYRNGETVAREELSGQRFFVNSGSFSEKDGLPHLINAMISIHEAHPDIKLVFTGNAPVNVRERIWRNAGLNAENWVVFTGFIGREELIWCYKNAIGLLSCRSNSDYANYGFPTKLAEYLASGRPVVATRVGDVEEYLVDGETAFLADPGDVKSIASAIDRLIQDPACAEKIGHRGVEVAFHYFNYTNHIEGVAKFIRKRVAIACH